MSDDSGMAGRPVAMQDREGAWSRWLPGLQVLLDELDDALHAAGIELGFAAMKDPVKDKLKRFGLFPRLGAERFFDTVGEAVGAYVQAHAVPWVDWEDRAR